MKAESEVLSIFKPAKERSTEKETLQNLKNAMEKMDLANWDLIDPIKIESIAGADQDSIKIKNSLEALDAHRSKNIKEKKTITLKKCFENTAILGGIYMIGYFIYTLVYFPVIFLLFNGITFGGLNALGALIYSFYFLFMPNGLIGLICVVSISLILQFKLYLLTKLN